MTKANFALFLFATSSAPIGSESFSSHSKLALLSSPSPTFPTRPTTFRSIGRKPKRTLPCSRGTWSSQTALASEPPSNTESESLSQEDDSSSQTTTSSPNSDMFDPILILPSLTLVGLALLVSMVVYTNISRPNSGLDVDLYMAIDGTLKANSDESIFALPPLSPAEQLVGALFGPPAPQ